MLANVSHRRWRADIIWQQGVDEGHRLHPVEAREERTSSGQLERSNQEPSPNSNYVRAFVTRHNKVHTPHVTCANLSQTRVEARRVKRVAASLPSTTSASPLNHRSPALSRMVSIAPLRYSLPTNPAVKWLATQERNLSKELPYPEEATETPEEYVYRMYLQFLWLPQVSQNNLPVALSDFHASPELPSLSQLTAHYKFPSDFIGSGPSTALWVCEIVTSTRCGVHAGSSLHALHAVQHRHLGTYCRQSLLSIVFGAILACRLRVLCSPSSGSDIIILCGRQKARRVKPCSGLARQFGLVSYDIQSSEPEHRASQGAPRVIGASAGLSRPILDADGLDLFAPVVFAAGPSSQL